MEALPLCGESSFDELMPIHPFGLHLTKIKKNPQDWEVLFERAHLAQAIGEEDAARLIGGDESGKGDPFKYVTPRKQALAPRLHQDSPGDDSWEGVDPTTLPGTPAFQAVDLGTLVGTSSS